MVFLQTAWNASGSWMTSYPFHFFSWQIAMIWTWCTDCGRDPSVTKKMQCSYLKRRGEGVREREGEVDRQRGKEDIKRVATVLQVGLEDHPALNENETCFYVLRLFTCIFRCPAWGTTTNNESRPSQREDEFACGTAYNFSSFIKHQLNTKETETVSKHRDIWYTTQCN